MENNEKTDVVITNVKVSRILKGLNELSKLDINNFDINYGITKLTKKLMPIEIAYNKTRKALMDENIPVDEKDGTYKVDGNKMYVYKSIENRDKYFKEINELNEKIVEGITFRIKASELKKIKGIKAETMIAINELIIDDLID